MSGAASISLVRFIIIYLLLLIVIAIMKKSKINQTKLLLLQV